MDYAARGGAAGDTPRLGAERLRRKLSRRKLRPAPYRGTRKPCTPANTTLLSSSPVLLQARQGLDQRPTAVARLYRSGRTFRRSIQVDTLRQRQGSLQARRDRGGGGSPQGPGWLVRAPPQPKNLRAAAGQGRRSQGYAVRCGRQGLAGGPRRYV